MINFVNPIHLACVQDDSNPNLALIYISGGVAHATNGKILVRYNLAEKSALSPDQIDILNGKYIHMNVWADMCKCDNIILDDEEIHVIRKGTPRKYDYSFPDGDEPFETHDSLVMDVKTNGEHARRLMCYDQRDLAKLAKIFRCDLLYFSHSKPGLGTVVFPGEKMGMFAIIKPIDAGGINRYIFM